LADETNSTLMLSSPLFYRLVKQRLSIYYPHIETRTCVLCRTYALYFRMTLINTLFTQTMCWHISLTWTLKLWISHYPDRNQRPWDTCDG